MMYGFAVAEMLNDGIPSLCAQLRTIQPSISRGNLTAVPQQPTYHLISLDGL